MNLFCSQDWLLILDLMKNEKKNELTPIKYTQREQIRSDLKKLTVYNVILFGLFSRIHVLIGIYPPFISPFVHIYNLLKFIDCYVPRSPFEIVACSLSSDSLSANSYIL